MVFLLPPLFFVSSPLKKITFGIEHHSLGNSIVHCVFFFLPLIFILVIYICWSKNQLVKIFTVLYMSK